MNVFLTDLQNSYYRYIRNSVPINIGYIGGYLKKIFGGEIDLYLFRKFEEIYEALKTVTPHVVGFGSYSWNTQLTLKTAQYLKELYPETIIAVGGPDVSPLVDVTVNDLQANPQIDFCLPNEGEGPMRNLVEACLSANFPGDIQGSAIKGCLSLDRETKQVVGSVIDRFEEDMNSIPSPYLEGLMDHFLDNPDYLPIIQTLRGCPYRCTFCVSGKNTWSKIKAFDVERVKAEIDYIAKKAATSYLRFAEENFGILSRDVEIAEYLMKQKSLTGFPGALSLYTDKHPTSRIKMILLLFKNLLPFCISFQSTTPEVLKNIKRTNLKEGTLKQAIQFAGDNELLLVSELIFALPGESKRSFLESVDKLIEYRFESIAINQLRILKGTEMDLPREREKYGVKTMFSMSENGYTKLEAMENIEIDEWVVSNNTLNESEYFAVNRLIFLLDFFHYRAIAKELLFFFLNYDIPTSILLMEVLKNPELCPVLCSQAEKFEVGMREFMHPTPEAVMEYISERMSKGHGSLTGIYRYEDRLMMDLLMNGRLDEVICELSAMGRALYYQKNDRPDISFESGLKAICEVVSKAFIPLDQPGPKEISIESRFDVVSWVRSKYARRLDEYRLEGPVPVMLKIREMDPYFEIWESDMTLLERFQRHFATLNSSNRRRFITTPSTDGVAAISRKLSANRVI